MVLTVAQRVLDDDLRRFGRLLHYGGVLLTVVCAAIGYSLLHAPTEQAIFDTSTHIEEVLLSVENAPLIRKQHAKITSTLDDVERRIAAVQSRVPANADAGDFLKEVTRIASEEQLSIRNFQPEAPVTKTGYSELEITLKGEGSFTSICRFFGRLGELSRLSKVKALTVSAGDGGSRYPMSATLIIYFGIQGSANGESGGARRG
jgi:Tfp pilus assembly protein PilO